MAKQAEIPPEQEAAAWLAATVAQRREAGEWGRVVVEVVVESGHVAAVRRQNDDTRRYAKKKSQGK